MSRHPHVLLITSDHMRHDALACNGNRFVHTPNLDRLAQGGVRFTNSYTPNPVCVPARAAITTGNLPHRCTGEISNAGRIRDGQPRIAEVFAEAGYRTYALGKLHYVPYSPPGSPRLLHGFQHAELTEEGRILHQFDPEGRMRGVEDYHDYLADVGWGGYERAHATGNNDVHPAPSPLPAEHYIDAWIASRTVSSISQHLVRCHNAPFFAWMSFTKPHAPYDPPQPYDRCYDPRSITRPFGNAADLATRNPVLRLARGHHGWQWMSPEAVQVARAHYYGMVTFQDIQIGKVLDFLEFQGLRENTIILYTSDHGDLLGDFGCFFKGNFLNGSARIPFIVNAPGRIPEGEVRHHLVGLDDILPTLTSLARVPFSKDVDGRDLSDVLRSNDAPGRDFYFGEHGGGACITHMVASHEWKYIHTLANGTEELYDLRTDPNELHNLAPEASPSVLQSWRDRLIRWLQDNKLTQYLDGGQLRRESLEIPENIPFQAGAQGWRWY